MTISHRTGSIFDSGADALVDPVNCVGTHGKGLALEFARRYPSHVKPFTSSAKRGEIQVGYVNHSFRGNDASPRWLLFFPTKMHWCDDSKIEWIESGLRDLCVVVQELNNNSPSLDELTIRTVAIPALGCGLGGLDWNVVRPMIDATFEKSAVTALVYGPQERGPGK